MAAFFVKLALYATTLGAAGLAFGAFYVGPGRARPRVLAAAAIASLTAAAVAGFRLLQDAATLAGGWASVAEPPYLSWTFEAQAQLLALLAAGVALLVLGGMLGRRWIGAAGGALALASFAMTGHLASEAAWLHVALGAHLLGVAFWVIAPFLLWPGLTRDDAALLARTRMFSRFAVGVAPIAIVAGVVLAFGLVERPADLIESAYGRLILVKALAATAALGLGALNKVWVTARLADDPARGRAMLRSTLGLDAVLFATALAAVAAATTVAAPPG